MNPRYITKKLTTYKAYGTIITAVVFVARLNAATPKAGQNFELDAIAACYVGGSAVTGGIGTVIGAVVGGLFIGVLNVRPLLKKKKR